MDPTRYYGPYRVKSSTVAVNATTRTVLAAENFDRVSLIISLSGANAIGISPRTTLGSGQGIQLTTGGTTTLDLDFERFGPLVGQAWLGFSTLATTVEVIEVVRDYDPDNPLWMRWNPNERAVSP